MSSKTTELQFLEDVSKHEMTIEVDQDHNRSILFRVPGSSYNHFRLNTWHNHLCISGDRGTFVFQRTNDMFTFFRMATHNFNYNKEKTLNINPGYWHEKLIAEDTRTKARKFCDELFLQTLRDILKEYCESNGISEETKDGIWQSLESEVDGCSTEHEVRDQIEAANWPDWDNKEQEDFAEYLKTDFWEVDLTDYTYHFIWCLYAIVWGIQQYDKFKEA